MKAISIESLDKNFKVESEITRENIVWLDAKEKPFRLEGVFYKEGVGYIRMPTEAAEKVSPAIAVLSRFTAGGRIRFKTNSNYIALKVETENVAPSRNMPRTCQSGFDIYRKHNGENIFHGAFVPPKCDITDGYSAAVASNGKEYEFTINLPLYDFVKEIYIALDKNSIIAPPDDYTYQKPVLFYGSSITEGGCASRPGNCYTSFLSRMLDCNYINLGFAGNAKGEPEMAEYIANQDMSVFVCDYDHNAPDAEHLEKTHLPLYRTVRAKHPYLPIIFISAPPLSWPGTRDKRKEVIYKTYKTALDENDQNVYFIDGDTLFDGEMADSCTVDSCHPNDLGFYRMAVQIKNILAKLLK